MRGSVAAAGVLLVLLGWHSAALPAGAQDPPVPSVRVDAIATDARGRRVLDLRPQEFEVRAHGAVQKISVELRKHPAARVFALYLDEFHVGAGAAAGEARDALTRFIERMRPGDRAVVVKPLEPISGVTLTGDREQLKAAVAGFQGRKGDYAPRTRFEEQYIGRAPSAVEAARTQIVTVGLTELAMRLGELQVDRAAIVLVSDGFERPGPSRIRRGGDVQGLARAASRLHLAVYAFSPSAPGADGTQATDTLRALAKQSGGEVVLGTEGMDAALGRMAADLDAYYALTFQPQVTDGRFHAIDVRARRPGVQVRARSGYWAPLESEWRAWLDRPSGARAAPIRELRRSTLIDTWVGIAPGADGRSELMLSWEPSARGASTRLAEAIILRARTRSGEVVFDGRVASARAQGAGRLARFPAPPGRIELDLTIPGSDGTLADTERRDVDVPDPTAGVRAPVLLAPAVYRARSAREFRAIVDDPQAPPTPSRAFSRADRLLVRVPSWDPRGTGVAITARVLNALGQPMRTIDRRSAAVPAVAEFELPLSWLAPGEYEIEIVGRTGAVATVQRVPFKLSQ